MGNLKHSGKVALVTGANSGIGFATAKRFADEGARVYVTGRRQLELDAAVDRIGPNAVGVRGDVTSSADLDHLYQQIGAKEGRLDILFANAGSGTFATLEQVTERHFDDIFGLNVKALLFTVQKALPLLKDGSAIILNASITAKQGAEAFGVYAASKAAVRSFARTWAVELKARKIRVNAISPGVVPTEGYTAPGTLALSPEQLQAFTEQMAARIPRGCVGTPDEIAKAVSFLASDDSSFINGFNLVVDGGMTQI